jgi:hypothetical protein
LIVNEYLPTVHAAHVPVEVYASPRAHPLRVSPPYNVALLPVIFVFDETLIGVPSYAMPPPISALLPENVDPTIVIY